MFASGRSFRSLLKKLSSYQDSNPEPELLLALPLRYSITKQTMHTVKIWHYQQSSSVPLSPRQKELEARVRGILQIKEK